MVQMYLRSIHCDEETDEAGADEPYVLVTAINLASVISIAGFPVPLPAFDVVRYGPFGEVDQGETHFAPGSAQSFWGLNGAPATLTDPDQAIFVVALMENDDGDAENLRGILKGIVGGSVLGSLSLDRADKVSALIRDVNSAIKTPTGAPNFDDKVGDPQELRFSRDELIQAESGLVVSKILTFSGDGGRYQLTFEVASPIWSRFTNLGGLFAGQPTAVSWGPGHLELFIHGHDGAIWHRWWDNNAAGFSNWESLGGNFPNGEISAVSWGPGHLEVFVRGHDNALWHKWWGNGWSGWESLGGGLIGAPTPVTWGPGHLEVFAFTSDGHLWHKWWNNGWFGWEDLGGTFDIASRIAPESWGPGHLEVFVKGNDNALWHKWWNNGWFGWERLGGEFMSAPNTVSWAPGHLNVFVRDNAGIVWQTWWNNDHWGA